MRSHSRGLENSVASVVPASSKIYIWSLHAKFGLRNSIVLSPTKFIQRTSALLEPFLSRYPELFPILHDISQHSPTKEYHMFSARWVLDSDFEFLCVEQ